MRQLLNTATTTMEILPEYEKQLSEVENVKQTTTTSEEDEHSLGVEDDGSELNYNLEFEFDEAGPSLREEQSLGVECDESGPSLSELVCPEVNKNFSILKQLALLEESLNKFETYCKVERRKIDKVDDALDKLNSNGKRSSKSEDNQDSMPDLTSQKLLEFIRMCLESSNPEFANIVQYADESTRNEFKVADPEKLAQQWGKHKGKATITVKKVNRSFTYLVKTKKQLKKVSKWRYKFLKNTFSSRRKSSSSSSDATPRSPHLNFEGMDEEEEDEDDDNDDERTENRIIRETYTPRTISEVSESAFLHLNPVVHNNNNIKYNNIITKVMVNESNSSPHLVMGNTNTRPFSLPLTLPSPLLPTPPGYSSASPISTPSSQQQSPFAISVKSPGSVISDSSVSLGSTPPSSVLSARTPETTTASDLHGEEWSPASASSGSMLTETHNDITTTTNNNNIDNVNDLSMTSYNRNNNVDDMDESGASSMNFDMTENYSNYSHLTSFINIPHGSSGFVGPHSIVSHDTSYTSPHSIPVDSYVMSNMFPSSQVSQLQPTLPELDSNSLNRILQDHFESGSGGDNQEWDDNTFSGINLDQNLSWTDVNMDLGKYIDLEIQGRSLINPLAITAAALCP